MTDNNPDTLGDSGVFLDTSLIQPVVEEEVTVMQAGGGGRGRGRGGGKDGPPKGVELILNDQDTLEGDPTISGPVLARIDGKKIMEIGDPPFGTNFADILTGDDLTANELSGEGGNDRITGDFKVQNLFFDFDQPDPTTPYMLDSPDTLMGDEGQDVLVGDVRNFNFRVKAGDNAVHGDV